MKSCIPRKEKKCFLCQQQKHYCRNGYFMWFIFAFSQDINRTWCYVEFLYWHKAIISKKIWGPYSQIFIFTLINLKSQSSNQNTEVLSQKNFDKILWRWDKNIFFFQLFIYLHQNKTKISHLWANLSEWWIN